MSELKKLEVTTSPCAWLPTELYRNIICVLAANDIAKICRVSRMLRDEAQPILYASFKPLSDDYNRILTWCRTINSCPHLAHIVYFLILPYELSLNNTTSRARAKLHTSLACALRKTVNLKGISIIELSNTLNGVSDRMFTLLPKMMIGCSFRLLAFCGRLSTDAVLVDWWKFFREQTEIRYWDPVPRIPGHGMILPRDMFPWLTAIVLRQTEPTSNTNLLFHLGLRPIQRLSLQWDMSQGNPLHVIRWLVCLSQQVTHFNWEALGSTSFQKPTSLDIILELVEQLPRLKFLRFSSGEPDSESCYGLMNALCRLEYIETAMLDILMTADPDEAPPTFPHIGSDYNSKECLEVAVMFMASCPNLRRFSFVVLASHDNDGQRRIYPCYMRRPGRKVQLEGFDLVDKDSWRDGM